MQKDTYYADIVGDLLSFFEERLFVALDAGIVKENIILDPGIGFGKTTEHNLEILNRLDEFCALGWDVMVGPSRKSVIGDVLNVPVEERLHGTSSLVALSILKGVRFVRVHDVHQMSQVARLTDAVIRSGK